MCAKSRGSFEFQLFHGSACTEYYRKAIMAKMPDFEDAIQFFSALSIDADCIITRNVKDFPADILPVFTPEAFLTQFKEQF